ncbi:MAG: DUF1643 domain-containing protein [Planctomycetota bacterium]
MATPTLDRAATLSKCGTYRWLLDRWWGNGPLLGFVMLNPSTADAEHDDATIRRCMGFAQSLGYDGIRVANVFPFRATDPSVLIAAGLDDFEMVQPEQSFDCVRAMSCVDVGRVIAAWGSPKHAVIERGVRRMLTAVDRDWWCLGRTKQDHPRHPLYLPSNALPTMWRRSSNAAIEDADAETLPRD